MPEGLEDSDDTAAEAPGLSAWFENHPAGRMIITVLIVVSLAAIGSTLMPDSVLKDRLVGWAGPFVVSTGLYQDWAIFSPNPRQETSFVLARVRHVDGSVAESAIDTAPQFPFSWGYRWGKFQEGLWLSPQNAWARPEYARWVVERDVAAGGRPTEVTLIRRWALSLPPGTTTAARSWQEDLLFTQRVATS